LTSNVIETVHQTNKTLQILIQRCLNEIDTGQKIQVFTDSVIETAPDVDKNISLKGGGDKKSMLPVDCDVLIGEACQMHNVILVSDGNDKLTIENKTKFYNSIFDIIVNVDKVTDKIIFSNTSYFEQSIDSNESPARFVLLNSKATNQRNTSLISNIQNGMPGTQRINIVAENASYTQIAQALTYNALGLSIRSNSYLYKIPARVFDKNGAFFKPNKLVKVFDEAMGIDEAMVLVGVGFVIDAKNGVETTLNLTSQDTYTIAGNVKIKKSLLNKKTGK
jgi:hypothetical protein